jgi:carbon-monoxide dehydrogenase large subunit
LKLATAIIGKATDDIIDKGRKIASFLLETGEIDIEFERGRYRVAGTDREVGIFEVARAAVTRKDLPRDLQGPLAGISDQTLPIASFPYGTQVCEVEVDPQTGEVQILRYAAVDDVGRAINPLILHGQTHGGIAQGVGQAMLESSVYELQNGQLLTASFMDYAMPRADTLPLLTTALSEVPSPTNRLGVRHIEMPATRERVWRAILAERSAAAARP